MLIQDQVITFKPDGSIVGLQRKDGIDMRMFGKAKINRISEILWNEEKQKWFVRFLFLENSIDLRNVLNSELYYLSQGILDKPTVPTPFIDIVYFNEYDEAVRAEIAALDYLRLSGKLT